MYNQSIYVRLNLNYEKAMILHFSKKKIFVLSGRRNIKRIEINYILYIKN